MYYCQTLTLLDECRRWGGDTSFGVESSAPSMCVIGILKYFRPCGRLSVGQTMTFERLDVRSSYLHIWYVSREYRSSSYMKVIGSKSRSQEQKGHKSPFPQCKTVICYSSGSIKHRAMRSACSIGLSAMVDCLARPPSLSRDRK